MEKKMGRPIKAGTERRDKPIQVRLTADEVKAVDAAAKADGKKRSEWARKTLLAAANVIQ
jgi:uncharacterized protein (DUF1778 family)